MSGIKSRPRLWAAAPLGEARLARDGMVSVSRDNTLPHVCANCGAKRWLTSHASKDRACLSTFSQTDQSGCGERRSVGLGLGIQKMGKEVGKAYFFKKDQLR